MPAIQPAEVEVNNTYAGKQADEDQGKTHRWLKAAGLKAETESKLPKTLVPPQQPQKT